MQTQQLLQGTGSQSTFMRFCQMILNLRRPTKYLSELATILGHGTGTWLRSFGLSKYMYFIAPKSMILAFIY